MAELMKSAQGGTGGRKGRGKSRVKRKTVENIKLGRGMKGIRWPGLSYRLPDSRDYLSALEWDKSSTFEPVTVDETDPSVEDSELMGVVNPRDLEDIQREPRRESEMGWDKMGWSGRVWGGKYVGCPELVDGTPIRHFRSYVLELKAVAHMTNQGRKRTYFCAALVGNGRGSVGLAVGRAEFIKPAVRKAKNRAVNYLFNIPRCHDHTIYHNIRSKFRRSKVLMERKVPGYGLRCHRAVKLICELAGIKDMRGKVIGSTSLMSVALATLKGLSTQETHQRIANRSGRFLVEFSKECDMRPLVVAIPKRLQKKAFPILKNKQLLHPNLLKASTKY